MVNSIVETFTVVVVSEIIFPNYEAMVSFLKTSKCLYLNYRGHIGSLASCPLTAAITALKMTSRVETDIFGILKEAGHGLVAQKYNFTNNDDRDSLNYLMNQGNSFVS